MERVMRKWGFPVGHFLADGNIMVTGWDTFMLRISCSHPLYLKVLAKVFGGSHGGGNWNLTGVPAYEKVKEMLEIIPFGAKAKQLAIIDNWVSQPLSNRLWGNRVGN